MPKSPPRQQRTKRITTSANAAVAPSIRRRREHEKRITRLFKAIDSDGDGFLVKRELSRGLRNPSCLRLIAETPALQPLLDPNHWEKTFHDMDGTDNTDGRITFTEFRRYCLEIVGQNDDGVPHNADIPTNEEAIILLQVPGEDKTELHIDALLAWSKINPATKKLFEPLPVDLLREVVREMKYMCVQPGEFVCEQGDIGSLFYVILKGQIDFYVRQEKEQEMEMDIRSAGGLGTAKPTSHELIVMERIGKLVGRIGVGKGFGELALLAPAKERATRSASCLVPTELVLQSDGSSNPAPCHLLTLSRAVYYRLFRVTQSLGTDIGAKVRTIQDSAAFSCWPRSHVVRFAINLNVIKIPKNEYLVRAGQKADKFFLLSTGEVVENQPITLKSGLNGTKTIVYPWSSNTNKTTEQIHLNKIQVDLGSYGPLDFVAGLPTMLDYPFYFTTIKAKTNVTAVVIGRTYFNMFLRPSPVLGVAEELPSFYQKTIKYLTSNVTLRETMRKQRVRAALASPNISIKMTTAMTRAFTKCGRCGRKGHAWGEENDYGMLKCPMASGAGGRSKKRHDSAFFSSIKRNNRKARNGESYSFRAATPKLLGSQRWSLRQSKRMRGGTPCTVGSLSTLLNRFEEEDANDAVQNPSKWDVVQKSLLLQRPNTSMARRTKDTSNTRPHTSMALVNKRSKERGEKNQILATPPKSAAPLRFSPLNKRRSQEKTVNGFKLSNQDSGVEFKDEYRSKKNKYVMSHDLTMEEEGRQFERELKVENPAMYSSILTERRT